MRLNCITRILITFSVIISILVLTSGCTVNQKSDLPEQRTIPSISPTQTISLQPVVSQPQTQNPTIIPSNTISTVSTPHFFRTISYGSNRSSALTEDQAWKYVEVYLRKIGIQNIQPSEIVPLGQNIWKDNDGHEEMVWGFRVTRIVGGVNMGGMITIDAYDGHVVDYAGYQ